MTSNAERTNAAPGEADSYYGRPILKEPAWKQPDVPLYLFLGGAAGSSASIAMLANATGRSRLARVSELAAAGGATASVGWLIHDLGRPERFLYMLRVFKPTSPLSVGSWILAPFSGLTTAVAASSVTGKLPRLGRLAGVVTGLLGPAMSTYTAVLLADTATPSWHEGRDTLPALFAGSALSSGAGIALATTPPRETGPVIRIGLAGAAAELAASRRLGHSLGIVSEPYRTGRGGKLLRAAEALTATGAGVSLLGKRSRAAAAIAGVSYIAAGLCTRFGVYAAGVDSSRDPKYVVVPQRERKQQNAQT